MTKKTIIILIIILTVGQLFAGCTNNAEKKAAVSIVTTIFPAYDFARAAAGDEASVSLLLPPGAEVHTFEPTARDMIKIQDCDLFIYNGGESDEWVEKLLSSAEYKDLNTLCMTDLVDTYTEEIKEGMDAQPEEEDEADEHVWTSPKNAVTIVSAIADKLSALDTAHAAIYNENAEKYISQLNALDSEFHAISREITNPVLVFADRFPMRYFAEEYGFSYYAAFPGCSSQTEPSARTVSFLIEKVKAENIPAVFCIEFSNGKLADTICEETGAHKYMLHSCHNVTRDDFESGKTYVDLMRQNIQTLKEAFGL